MTREEHVGLLDVAKAVSVGQAPPAALARLYGPAAGLLAAHGWDRTATCLACPRPMHLHTCGCPHHQARKRLQSLGVWPDA